MLLVFSISLSGCVQPTPEERAAAFLESRQSGDGSWRSSYYKDMDSGYELTPVVAKALFFSNRRAASARGERFMQHASSEKLAYPVLTSATMLALLGPVDEARPWQARLLKEQSWEPGPRYGSFGDVSSTGEALGALRMSGFPVQHASMLAGVWFLTQQQQQDGSLGNVTSTANGIRGLLRGGMPPLAEPVGRASQWMVAHLLIDQNFYALASTAHAVSALHRTGMDKNPAGDFGVRVRAHLQAQQKPDGSFRGEGWREDEPLLATAYALAALQLYARR